MAAHYLFSQQVHAVLLEDAWDEAYFSLLSLKHALAGVPGWKRMDIMANNQDDGSIHLRVLTHWATLSQLEAWLKSDLTVEGVLKGVTPPPPEIAVSFYQKVS
jgi:heme-degrading monooxygenase HmoA